MPSSGDTDIIHSRAAHLDITFLDFMSVCRLETNLSLPGPWCWAGGLTGLLQPMLDQALAMGWLEHPRRSNITKEKDKIAMPNGGTQRKMQHRVSLVGLMHHHGLEVHLVSENFDYGIDCLITGCAVLLLCCFVVLCKCCASLWGGHTMLLSACKLFLMGVLCKVVGTTQDACLWQLHATVILD